MKRTAAFLLALLMLLCAFSCAKKDPAGTTTTDGNADASPASPSSGDETAEPVDLDELVRGICEKYDLTAGFIFTSKSTELGEYLDEDLIQSYYGDVSDKPDFTKVSEYCLYVDESDPNIIIDVGVFRMADPSYADTLMKYLQARIDVKIENGARYTNIDVATLKKSVVSKAGDCVFYVISYSTAEIVADIRAALGK